MRFLALLLLLTSPLAATPRAGIELEVSPPSSGPSTHARYIAGIAYHGDEGFVVWSDWRMRSHSLAFGSRIDADGQLLDPDGIRLFTHPLTNSRALGVAWTGDAFVVATTEANRVDVRRVRPDGTFDGVPVVIHSNDPDLYIIRRSHVMSIGSSVLVAWSTYFSDHAVLIRSDLSSATPINLGTMRLTATTQSERDYVLFLERSPVGAAGAAIRIAPDGTSTTIDLPHAVRAAVWTGRDYLIGYRATTTDVFARLAESLETQQNLVQNIPLRSWEELSLVAGKEVGEAIIVWSHATGVEATVLRSDNSTEAPRTLAGQPAAQVRPTLARSESGLVLLRPWLEPVLFTESLQLRSAPGRAVLRTNAAQQQLAIARDGQGGPILFIEDGAAGRRVMIAPRPGAASRRLTDHAWEFAPAIASSPTTSLVAWTHDVGQDARVRAMILDRNGQPITAEPITVGAGYWGWADSWDRDHGSPWSSTVVWTGEMYLVAWITGNVTRDLVFQRVLENGTVLDPEPRTIPRLGPDLDEQSQPVMTRIDDETLLVWTEGRRFECNTLCTGRSATVRAMRLSRDGQLIDPNGLEIAPETISIRPDIAVVGDTALIVWTHNRTIYGRRLTEGLLSERMTIARGNDVSVARHRDQFLVVVQDYPTIHGVMMSKEGELGSTFQIADSTWQPEGPLAWTTAEGTAAVAYLRGGHHTGLVPRLFYRVITDQTPSRRRAVR
jgi:hypothetical protein